MRRHILLGMLALLGVGPVPAQEGQPDAVTGRETCIESRRINGWTSEGDRILIVTLGASRRYRVELSLSAVTLNVGSQAQLAFIPRSDGMLCANWGHVGVDGQRILIRSITALPTPPKGERPGEPEK
ncbi:hypothetical protein [Niveispirillum sp. KHB5.9]|uniref:hypothetical protein n=1 Tax=Niveispirillum sp. KHB5.9 TaxID=3400269 RepID=UPI003A83FD40